MGTPALHNHINPQQIQQRSKDHHANTATPPRSISVGGRGGAAGGLLAWHCLALAGAWVMVMAVLGSSKWHNQNRNPRIA
jgi:hypothetical protein